MRTKPRPSVYDLSFDAIAEVTDHATATRTYRQLYRERRQTCPELDRVRAALDLTDTVPLRRTRTTPGRMSTKVLFALPDGNAIGAVRIRRRTGMTACVSSQVGCAFGCTFCASGKFGLQRHLRAGEIVQQVLELGPKVNRIVFMGIGEPLHNYDHVPPPGRQRHRQRRPPAHRTALRGESPDQSDALEPRPRRQHLPTHRRPRPDQLQAGTRDRPPGRDLPRHPRPRHRGRLRPTLAPPPPRD